LRCSCVSIYSCADVIFSPAVKLQCSLSKLNRLSKLCVFYSCRWRGRYFSSWRSVWCEARHQP